MDNFCLLVSGGEFSDIPSEMRGAEFVIACDSGWRHAEKLGLKCDMVIGDFDSSTLPSLNIPIECVPTEKDDTDTMLAARRALKLGYRNIAVCCAFGGRLDHTLANIQMSAFLVANGARVRMVGAGADALVFSGRTEYFFYRKGWSLSVFALSDCCEGVSIKGTKYECENVKLVNSFPLGVSNLCVTKKAKVSVDRGILMVLQAKLGKGEHI